MTLDPKRTQILNDLIKDHVDRSFKVIDSLVETCSVVNIPKHEVQTAISAVYLMLFMSLIHESKPTMTPSEMGLLMQSQFSNFKRLHAK